MPNIKKRYTVHLSSDEVALFDRLILLGMTVAGSARTGLPLNNDLVIEAIRAHDQISEAVAPGVVESVIDKFKGLVKSRNSDVEAGIDKELPAQLPASLRIDLDKTEALVIGIMISLCSGLVNRDAPHALLCQSLLDDYVRQLGVAPYNAMMSRIDMLLHESLPEVDFMSL